MKKVSKILVFVMLIALLATCFVGCAPNNEKILSEFNSAFKGTNVLDADLGLMNLPGLSEKISKAGATLEYTVVDSLGNKIEVKDGKFDVKMGGEYNVSLVLKNKKGEVLLEKTYSVTENGVLTNKLSAQDIEELKGKRDAALSKVFSLFNVDYAKYKLLTQDEKNMLDESLVQWDSLARFLSDGIITSGLSKATLTSLFDNIDQLFASGDPTNGFPKDSVNFIKNFLDTSLSSMFNGEESPIAVANVIYEVMLLLANKEIDNVKSLYDINKINFDVVNALPEAAEIEEFLKKTKLDTLDAIAKFNDTNKDLSDDEYAKEVFRLYESYGVLPSLSDADIAEFFAANNIVKSEFLDMKKDVSNLSFYTLSGAMLYSNPTYKHFVADNENKAAFVSNNALGAYLDNHLPDGIYYSMVDALDRVYDISYNELFIGLYSADENNLTNNALTFINRISTLADSEESIELQLVDLNALIANKDDMVANKASSIESYCIASKVSNVLSPIVTSSLTKEFMTMYLAKMVYIEYIPSFVDMENGTFNIATSDITAILTAMDSQLGKFIAKYDGEFDKFDNLIFDTFSDAFANEINDGLTESEMVNKEVFKNIFSNYFKLVKPVVNSVKELVGMANNNEFIDFLKANTTGANGATDLEKNVLELNKYLAVSKIIINVIDSSKGLQDIDTYLGKIKTDLLADEKVAALIEVADLDDAIATIKRIYTLSLTTCLLAQDEMLTPPQSEDLIFETAVNGLVLQWRAENLPF